VCNGENYLGEALADLLAQTFGDFELLISDNASEDDTEDICRQACSDPRVRYVRQPRNIGAAANYNYVFHNTGGSFFRWASHDDRCRPGHLEACLRRFEAGGPDAVLVYPRTVLIDETGSVIGPHEDRLEMHEPTPAARLAHLAREWGMCNPVVGLQRRSAAARTGLIRTFRGSDLVFLAEMALQGTVLEAPEPLFLRRIHQESAMQGSGTDAATWLDPDASPRRFVPHSTMPILLETLRAIHNSDLDMVERLQVEQHVATTWLARRARVIGGRAKRVLRERATAGLTGARS
jgi:glycosyltransferase involved in cell wall biosynthesis